MPKPTYVRLTEESAEDLMAQVNIHADAGYRLMRWYERPVDGIFLAIMELRNR